jgi:hypothetical protein
MRTSAVSALGKANVPLWPGGDLKSLGQVGAYTLLVTGLLGLVALLGWVVFR